MCLNKLSHNWADMLSDDRYREQPWPNEPGWYRTAFAHLGLAVENDVYGTFAYLLGLLPSAGFIGTVWGISHALRDVSGLFGAGEKERTMGEITRHLGFAFDATLLA